MAHHEGLKPLGDEGEEEEEEEEDKNGVTSRPPRRVLVVGTGAAGIAVAFTLQVMMRVGVWECADGGGGGSWSCCSLHTQVSPR